MELASDGAKGLEDRTAVRLNACRASGGASPFPLPRIRPPPILRAAICAETATPAVECPSARQLVCLQSSSPLECRNFDSFSPSTKQRWKLAMQWAGVCTMVGSNPVARAVCNTSQRPAVASVSVVVIGGVVRDGQLDGGGRTGVCPAEQRLRKLGDLGLRTRP